MSRVRASSQGPRKPLGGGAQPLSLEQMRERMLTRRNVDLRMNPADVQRPAERPPTSGTAQPLFVGRSLVISNSPPHPSSNADDAADPHKLFQMLRRKKRAAAPAAQPAGPSVVAATRHSPDRSQPHPSVDGPAEPPLTSTHAAASVPPPPPSDVPPRPQGAGRPLGAMRQAFSAGAAHPPPASQQGPRPAREISSATPIPSSNSAPDGRPVTRQKLPTQALDLFPSSSPGTDKPGKAASEKGKGGEVSEADPFPKPAPAAGQRKGSASRQMPSANAADPVANGGKRIDFSCLFVSGEGDLGMPDEFPSSPKAKVDIPLIETEWFNPQSTWEALPGGAEEAPVPAGKGGARSNEGSFEVDAADSSQSLYDLLVATKGRRSATHRR